MVSPAVPGTPFGQVISINSAGRRAPRLRPLNPVSPLQTVPSSLNGLSNEQIIGLGLASAGAGAVVGSFFENRFDETTPTFEQVNPLDPGEFGQPGEELRVIVIDGVFGVERLNSTRLRGPITATLVQFEGFPGDFFEVWLFEGFDAQGNPLTEGGQSAGGGQVWSIDRPDHTFTIERVAEPGIALAPNPGTGSPIVIEPDPSLPSNFDLGGLATQSSVDITQQSIDANNGLLNQILPVAEQALDTLEDRIRCEVCGLISQLQSEVEQLRSEQQSEFLQWSFIRDYLNEIDTVSVELPSCDENAPPNGLDFTNTNLRLFIDLLQHLLDQGVTNFFANCLEAPGIPEAWLAQPIEQVPTLVLTYRVRDASGTPLRSRTLSIPHASGQLPQSSNTYTQGRFQRSILFRDRTAIRVYASTEQGAIDQANFMLGFTDGSQPIRSTQTIETSGIVANEHTRELIRAEFYANGREGFPEPDAVTRFRQLPRNTINPPI